MKQLLVIGSGVAAVATVEYLLNSGANVEITMYEGETQLRPGGARMAGGISSVDTLAWCQSMGVGLQLGVRVVEIDVPGKTVTGDDGSISPYDVLLIATGTAPRLPSVLGMRKRNVFIARDAADAIKASSHWQAGSKVVVIADSLEGLETAQALAYRCELTVALDAKAATRNRVDWTVAKYLIGKLERAGVQVITGKAVTALVGNGRVECLDFDDGSELDADAVVIPSFLRPDVDLARRGGLLVNEGILVNDHMEASADDVFAVGECVEHRRMIYRDDSALLEQARVAAAAIAGDTTVAYGGSIEASSRRILDVDLYSAGEFDETLLPEVEVVRYEDPALGVYKKLLLSDGKLIGAVLTGDLSGKDRYTEWIRHKTDLSSMRQSLLFPPGAESGCNITKSFTGD